MVMQQMSELLLANGAIQARMEAKTEAIQAETKTIHKRMMAKLNTHQERPMAHSRMTKIDPVRRMMPSAEEHHKIPNREAAVTPVRELKKRQRVHNLVADYRQKKQERTRETCGSRKFATTHRGIAHCAGVAQRREHGHKRYNQDCVAAGSPEGQMSGMRPKRSPGCNNGTSDRGQKQPLRGNRRIEDLCSKLPLHFANKKATNGIYWKTIRLEILKRAVGISSRLQRIINLTLWRDRPPSEKEEEPICSFGSFLVEPEMWERQQLGTV
jgi:hypothetical protein